MVFTQKESTILEDLKKDEKLCVEKYAKYAKSAKDPQLNTLFTNIADTEREHLDTVTKLTEGTIPNVSSSQSSVPAPDMALKSSTYSSAASDQEMKNHDKFLCSDCLATEKHVSSTYNTDIFEFRDPKVRDVLNHIQKEEQQHGELLYHYMSQNSMY